MYHCSRGVNRVMYHARSETREWTSLASSHASSAPLARKALSSLRGWSQHACGIGRTYQRTACSCAALRTKLRPRGTHLSACCSHIYHHGSDHRRQGRQKGGYNGTHSPRDARTGDGICENTKFLCVARARLCMKKCPDARSDRRWLGQPDRVNPIQYRRYCVQHCEPLSGARSDWPHSACCSHTVVGAH